MSWRVVSVRGYFLTVVSLAVLAALVLVLDLTAQQRRQLTATAGQDAFQLARLAANAHERALAETQQTLELLARFPQVRSGEGCGALLAELRQRLPRYVDLGVASPDGTVICSAPTGAAARGSVADRAWFRTAGEWRQLGVGEYRVDRATGRAVVTTGGHDRDALRRRVGIEAMELRHHGAATRVEEGVFRGGPALREDVDQMVVQRVALQVQKLG